MNLSSRAAKFCEFVGRGSFVCTIGAAQARKQELDVMELPEQPDAQCNMALDAVKQLVERGRGAATVLLYPGEPASYENLQAMHSKVHASVFAACVVHDAVYAERQGALQLPHQGLELPTAFLPLMALESRQRLRSTFAAYDAKMVIQDFRLRIAKHPHESMAVIRDAVQSLLAIDPNATPCVHGEVLQAIVMSPVYTGDLSDRVCALLPSLGMQPMPHGRYAPATAMVINHSRAVLDAAKGPHGAVIRQRMLSGASAYRYDPMHVLAEKPNEANWYLRLQQAVAATQK